MPSGVSPTEGFISGFPIARLNRDRWTTPITPEIYRSFSTRVLNQSETSSSTVNFTKSAGIPENKIGLGTMQGPTGYSTAYWDVNTAMSRMTQAFIDYPQLRGGYLWEAGRAGTADWANRVGGLILSKAV